MPKSHARLQQAGMVRYSRGIGCKGAGGGLRICGTRGSPGYLSLIGGTPGYLPLIGGSPGCLPLIGGTPGYLPLIGGSPGRLPLIGTRRDKALECLDHPLVMDDEVYDRAFFFG